MTLQSRVAEHAASLTAADRALLQVLLSHVTEAAFLSAADVARRAGVHEASATKLAQRLGYAGYPALRKGLQRDLLNGTDAAERMNRSLEHASDGDILTYLIADESSAINDVSRQVRQESLDEAAQLLVGARHRYVFAHGNATVLADLLERRMRRFGMPMISLVASGRDIAENLVALGPDDVVVTFGFLRIPVDLGLISQYRGEVGAKQILITDTLGGTLEPLPDVTLAAARGSGTEFQSLTIPMAITNALILTVANIAHETTTKALTKLESLLARFDR